MYMVNFQFHITTVTTASNFTPCANNCHATNGPQKINTLGQSTVSMHCCHRGSSRIRIAIPLEQTQMLAVMDSPWIQILHQKYIDLFRCVLFMKFINFYHGRTTLIHKQILSQHRKNVQKFQ